jgi:chorismate mutase
MNATRPQQKLKRLRARVDAADRRWLAALAARFRATDAIGALKRRHDLPIRQPGRWAAVRRDRRAQARRLGLDPRLVDAVLALIHAQSLRAQRAPRARRRGKR